MKKSCTFCLKDANDFYGYPVCQECINDLGLLSDKTIAKHIELYNSTKKHSYSAEIKNRLDFIEKDCIKKKIKLNHILDRLQDL